MLNAKRIFFIVLSNVGVRLFRRGIYSTSNSQPASAARGFERAHAQKHPTTNGYALHTNQKRANHGLHGCHGLGSARGSRAGLRAWPSLRVRWSDGLAETTLYSATKHTKS